MSTDHGKWTLQTVPPEFWERIEDARGDIEAYRESLRSLSERELREVFSQFKGLQKSMVMGVFKRLPAALQEEDVLKLEEIASWVITQGRSLYEEVLDNPASFPTRDEVRRPIFAGAVIRVYTEQFGPWRS